MIHSSEDSRPKCRSVFAANFGTPWHSFRRQRYQRKAGVLGEPVSIPVFWREFSPSFDFT